MGFGNSLKFDVRTIYDIKFSTDIVIQPLKDRLYEIPHDFSIYIRLMGAGKITIRVKKGFVFDGRSGGKLIDLIVPHLGTQHELKCWVLHDLLFYDILYCFDSTNNILRWDLLNNAKYGKFKAWLVWKSVQLFGRSNFGMPVDETDPYYNNIEKIKVFYTDR